MFESLETRRHFAISLAGNVLTITGTTRSDDIAIAAGRQTFVVHDNGREHAFDVNKVKTIRINGGRGDDSIIISPRLNIRASIEAGPGNDRVGGGARNDTIFGQDGNDVLVGNGGANYFDAGPGNDQMEAFAEGNVFHGGSGTDGAAMLWSVIEYGSGVESPSYPRGQIFTHEAASIVTEGDRLLLRFVGGRVSGDRPVKGDLTLRADGFYEVRETFYYGYGGEEFEYSWRVDITDSVGKGFVFARTIIYPEDYGDPVPPPSTTEVVMMLPGK